MTRWLLLESSHRLKSCSFFEDYVIKVRTFFKIHDMVIE